MRFTRASLYMFLAFTIPIGLSLVPFQSPPASAEGQETSFTAATLAILTIWSFISFSIAALISTRPSGGWGKAVRRASLYLVALVLGLFSAATIYTLLAEPSLMGIAFLPIIPGSFACLRTARREDLPSMPAEPAPKITALAGPVALVFGILVIATALVAGVEALANALGADVLAKVLAYFPLAVLVLIFGGPIAGYVARTGLRARGYDANAGICFFQPIDKWQKLDDDQAGVRWSKAFNLPLGGTLTQAWDFAGVDMTRIHCRDTAGEVYLLIDGPPTLLGPSPQWVAGLFLRAESDEPGGPRRRSVRLFERIGCHWESRTEEETADDLRRLGGERPPGHLGAWQCADCGAIRLDFQSSDGRVLIVFRKVPEEPEPAYYAGYFFMYASTLHPRSSLWSQPQPGQPSTSSSSPPTAQLS